MIIAFKETVEGVLLACEELMVMQNCELISARDKKELKRKLEFTGVKEVKMLGFGCVSDTLLLIKRIYGVQRPGSSRQDPDIEGYISMVLRHRSSKPVELVHFLYSCRGSAEMLYSGKDRISKRYYTYMREVSSSYHRLCMFARPSLVNGVLSIKIDSQHRIGDMFCRWLARKNPDLPVSVIEGDIAWIGNGGHVALEHFTKVPSSLAGNIVFSNGDDEIDDMWDVYYNSQMIPKRRNRDHARNLQPKTSSSLSNMSSRDRYKVERGIATCTLDKFSS